MHICYIVKRFPRLSQTFILNELLAHQRRGVRLTVVALRRSDEAHAGYAELRAPVLYLDALAPAALDSVAQGAAVARLLAGRGVTHLHAHFATRAAAVAAVAGEHLDVPFSFTAHAHDIFHLEVDRAALAAVMARASAVVTVSDYNQAYLEQLARSEGCVARVQRIYNGIDLARLRPSAAPRRPGLIVGVGRLIAKKGFATLIASIQLVRAAGLPVSCVIIGEGEERRALEAQIVAAGLGECVHLVGARSPATVARIVGEAEVFALPCVVGKDGDRDGMPTVLLEAMALGTPVVSTDVAGIPELVRHGQTGLLAAEGDAHSLAAALACLLEDRALRARLARAALEHVRANFDLDRNAATLRTVFAGTTAMALGA